MLILQVPFYYYVIYAYTGLWWGNLRERENLRDPDVDGRIILKIDIKVAVCGGMDWIALA
jgi:hypothetical protein